MAGLTWGLGLRDSGLRGLVRLEKAELRMEHLEVLIPVALILIRQNSGAHVRGLLQVTVGDWGLQKYVYIYITVK